MWPYKAPTTGPLADAIKDAMKFALARETVFVRGRRLDRRRHLDGEDLETPVMFSASPPGDGYHAPNENYDWQQASGASRVREVLREREPAAI